MTELGHAPRDRLGGRLARQVERPETRVVRLGHEHHRQGIVSGCAALAALFGLCFGVYYPMLSHYFVSDDFVNVDFVRTYSGSLWAFLDPRRMPSDPVTLTRYKPGYVYYFWALDRAFGDHVVCYQLWSLVLHATIGTLVLLLVRRLTQRPLCGFLAAMVFVTSRAHVQMVLWASANYRLASTALIFGAIVVLFSRRAVPAILCSCLMFSIALSMNPEVIVLMPILAAFLIHFRLHRGANRNPGWRFAVVSSVDLIASAGFVVANHISSLRFGELPVSPAPSLERVLLFLIHPLLPFQLPLGLKIATTVVVISTLALRSVPLLAGALTSALLWGCLKGYALTPRYFYISSAFMVIGLVFFLDRLAYACCWLAGKWFRARRDDSSSPSRRDVRRDSEHGHCEQAVLRFRHTATCAACALFVVFNVVAIRQVDLVHWDYLQLLGRRLHDLQVQSRRTGRRPSVFVSPFSHLNKRDLDFFRHDLDFVDSEAAATDVVSTDIDRYRPLLSPRIDERSWYLPWLDEDQEAAR